MKTASSILAYISLSLIIIGSLFKILHWPGAGVMLVAGTMFFSTAFIPVYTVFRIRENSTALFVVESIAFAGSAFLLSVGLLFKVQHWPGSGVLLVLGLAALCAVFIPIFLLLFIKEKEYRKSTNIIGLMICIAGISMVLALKASRTILSSYVYNNEVVVSNVKLNQINNMRRFNSIMTGENEEVKNKMENIHERSIELVELIEKYKIHLIAKTDNIPEDLSKDEYDLRNVQRKDNYDFPTVILVGSEPGLPRKGEWSANELKNEFTDYKTRVLDLVSSEQTKLIIEEHFAFEATKDESGLYIPWESHYFYHMPLASCIVLLSSFQNTVLEIEALAMQELSD